MSAKHTAGRAAIMNEPDLEDFDAAFAGAIESLALLSKNVRDEDALDLVALWRHVVNMRSLVAYATTSAAKAGQALAVVDVPIAAE